MTSKVAATVAAGDLDPGPADAAPLYGRIVEDLKRSMRSGELARGSALPSERHLEQRYDVSRITVRRALDELAREGLIDRSRGRRSVVSSSPGTKLTGTISGGLTDLLHLGRVTNARVLAFEWRIASAEVAAALGLEEGDQVLYVSRLRVREDEPMLHIEVHLPRRVGLLIDRRMLERAPILDLMIEAGVGVVSSQQTIAASPCPDWLAPHLRVEAGSPTLRIDRIVRDGQDAPVQLLTGHAPWDRYSFRIDVTHLGQGDAPVTGVRAGGSGLVASSSRR